MGIKIADALGAIDKDVISLKAADDIGAIDKNVESGLVAWAQGAINKKFWPDWTLKSGTILASSASWGYINTTITLTPAQLSYNIKPLHIEMSADVTTVEGGDDATVLLEVKYLDETSNWVTLKSATESFDDNIVTIALNFDVDTEIETNQLMYRITKLSGESVEYSGFSGKVTSWMEKGRKMNVQILNNDLSLFGIVTGFESVEFVRSFNSFGEFSLKINANNKNAKYIKTDKIVYISDNQIGYIDKITIEKKSNKQSEYIIAEGAELKDRLSRIIYPSDGNDRDSYTNERLETVVKSLIKKNAGTLASSARQIPNLVTANDMLRGELIDYSARYKDLSTEIYSLLASQQMGLSGSIDFDNVEIVFDVVQGNDLKAAESTAGGIVLSMDTKTALEMVDTKDKLSYKNLSVTAGLGQGVEREILEVGTDSTGYYRREVFTEAGDIENNDELETRGKQKLIETAKTRGIWAKVNNFGSYQVGDDFDLGDFISADADGELFDGQVVKIKDVYKKGCVKETEITLDFDSRDTLTADISARHMDYDALIAKEKNRANIVADISLSQAATQIVIDDLDMKSDGDIYNIYISAKGTSNYEMSLYANSNPGVSTDVKSQRLQSADTLTASGVMAVPAAYYFDNYCRIGKLRTDNIGVTTGQIIRTDNMFVGRFASSLLKNGQQIYADYGIKDYRTQSNVTKLILAGPFAAGATVKIVRFCR